MNINLQVIYVRNTLSRQRMVIWRSLKLKKLQAISQVNKKEIMKPWQVPLESKTILQGRTDQAMENLQITFLLYVILAEWLQSGVILGFCCVVEASHGAHIVYSWRILSNDWRCSHSPQKLAMPMWIISDLYINMLLQVSIETSEVAWATVQTITCMTIELNALLQHIKGEAPPSHSNDDRSSPYHQEDQQVYKNSPSICIYRVGSRKTMDCSGMDPFGSSQRLEYPNNRWLMEEKDSRSKETDIQLRKINCNGMIILKAPLDWSPCFTRSSKWMAGEKWSYLLLIQMNELLLSPMSRIPSRCEIKEVTCMVNSESF